MRLSKTLKRIREGGLARCANLGNNIPPYIAHAARAGYDCIWLDLEHRGFEYRELQALLAHFRLYNIDCLLRAPTLEKTGLYRYLEDGATGIMIPHVSTAAKARDLVQSVKFPPLGDRGLDNAGFDSDYRITSNNIEYTEWANRETFLVLQIETPEAVENVEEIAAVPGVDMLFVGPGDLGLRYQLAGANDDTLLEAAIERVADACKTNGVPWAIPAGTVEDMKKRRTQGARMLANCGDFMMLRDGLAAASAMFEEVT
ncbi:MAG: 4-hydroxy-2-oxovalerate aldolase [Verrucomicrobiaceae bacterium]|nr:4-hydroxy-2-oxovalerate aldolase [Verrucomicrobiaceae bacterium]